MLRGRGGLRNVPLRRSPATSRSVRMAPMPYRRGMRLILDAELRSETLDRLRALPGLDVVDRSGDDTFDARRLADPEVEILSRAGRRPTSVVCRGCAGSRSARPGSTTWPPIRRG